MDRALLFSGSFHPFPFHEKLLILVHSCFRDFTLPINFVWFSCCTFVKRCNLIFHWHVSWILKSMFYGRQMFYFESITVVRDNEKKLHKLSKWRIKISWRERELSGYNNVCEALSRMCSFTSLMPFLNVAGSECVRDAMVKELDILLVLCQSLPEWLITSRWRLSGAQLERNCDHWDTVKTFTNSSEAPRLPCTR